jgi:hypothetical protein
MPKSLPLRAILSTTALASLALAALPAQAACTDDGVFLDCSGPGNAALIDSTDGKTFVINPGAAIGPVPGIALTLGGDAQTVINDGLVQSDDNEAIVSTGANLIVLNSGEIQAPSDRAIRLFAGADGATILNFGGATISSDDIAIEAENDDNVADVFIENDGLIESTGGRAIQSRGPGTTVFNSETGMIIGAEEVIEARTDFTLENRGTIMIGDPTVDDEDGVQFASGRVDNYGLIQGSDDGIDVDEGTIVNHAGGIIRTRPPVGEPGGNGIDADGELQDPVNGDGPAGLLTVENGGLVEGSNAIGVADDRTAAVNVINSGTLRGTTGVAIGFNGAMEASTLEIFDGSMIFGDVLLTDSDDTVTIGALSSGQFTDTFFDGRGGDDTVLLDGYALSDITRFVVSGAEARLTLATLSGNVTGAFRNFELWSVGGVTYSTSDLSGVAPVPLPAGLPLLGGGLAGLWALRRRAA